MRKAPFIPFLVLIVALSASRVDAQSARFGFVERPKPGRTVSGVYLIRVSVDPYVRPKTARPAVTIDGEILGMCELLPWERAWDTTSVAGGEHVIRLVFIDSRTGLQTAVDEIRIDVRNTPVPTSKPPIVEPNRSTVPARPSQNPPLQTGPDSLIDKPAEVVDEPKPLASLATALRAVGGKLYIGLASGGITICGTDGKAGKTIRPPLPAGPVRAIEVAGGEVWWLASVAPDPRDPPPTRGRPVFSTGPQRLFRYRESDKTTAAYDLQQAQADDVSRITLWRGKVFLLGYRGGVVLDPKSGSVERPESVLPREAFTATDGGALHLAASAGGALLIVAGRVIPPEPIAAGLDAPQSMYSLTFWRSDDSGRWATAGSCPYLGGANPCGLPIQSSADRVLIVDPTGLIELHPSKLGQDGWDASMVRLPEPNATRVLWDGPVLNRRDLWGGRGRALLHVDLDKKTTEAFLRWNETGEWYESRVGSRGIAADSGGAWVATDSGIRRVGTGEKPDPKLGYAGFVRVRLGGESDSPRAERERRLAEEIAGWQSANVPYKLGGESKSGIDCSGFVMMAFRAAGIGLPHGSDNLRSCKQGTVVHDELRYGDVLVYPGHCAIYVGNGLTAETVSGRGVSTGSIWNRDRVAVRRFLDATPSAEKVTASRRAARR